MRRTLLVAGAALVLVVAATLVWWFRSRPAPSVPPSAAAPAPMATAAVAPATPTVLAASQEDLENDILRNGATPEKAALLFSLVVAPLPGVTIPANIVRDPTEFDGTIAVQQLYAVWDFLTPAQRAAVARVIRGADASPAPRVSALHPDVTHALFVAPDDPPPAQDYFQLLVTANTRLAPLVGQSPIRFLYDVDPEMAPNGTAYAATFSWYRLEYNGQPVSGWKEYPENGCHITFFNPMFNGLDQEDALAVVTHELFHCYQQRAAGDAPSDISLPPWIAEGEATWAMVAAVPSGSKVVEKYWTSYAASPKTPYMDRKYDALGAFAHMSDTTSEGLVWAKLLPMVKQAVGGDNDTPFFNLTQGHEEAYMTSWGSSYFLAQGKTPWTMTGPGHPPQTSIGSQTMKVDAGSGEPVYVDAYRADLRQLTGNADIIGVTLFTGYGRLHDEGFGVDLPLDTSGKLALCVKAGGCRCPDGSAGASLITKKATLPISIGLESGGSSAQMYVMGLSLDDFCKKKKDEDPKDPQNPGGGGGGGGGDGGTPPDPHNVGGTSQGDTHLTTFDGLKYDFQPIGEFVLARSTRDGFIVQTRQVPVVRSRLVSVNQAMATKIGDRRVTIQIENDSAILRVDGAVVNDAVTTLPLGSIVRSATVYGPTFTIEWADGTRVRVAQLGASVLNVKVEPATARQGKLAGLLGDDDGSPLNDLVATGGTKLGMQPSTADLTHGFADAWRISQADSLFDYQPGQSVATFADSTFPDSTADPGRVPNRETAERDCREMGITDRHLLDNCIVDFALTSDFVFASSYSHEQQLIAARAFAAPAPTRGVLRTVTMSGTMVDPDAKPAMQFSATQGDIVWIGQPDCTDQYIEIGMTDPAGKGLSGGWPCAVGRRVLPATGVYTMRGYRTGNPLGPYHVPIRFVRPDRARAVAYGDVIFGNVETRGAHDVYTFAAKAGDLLRVAGAGCELGNLVIGITLPSGKSMLGPNCRTGTDFRITVSGMHQLVVNDADGGSGAYHFVLQGAAGTQ